MKNSIGIVELDITILNWDKYQLRKEIKNPSWFRLEHRFWNDQQFFHFSAEERWVWVCLLSITSQKQSPTFKLNVEWFSQESRVGVRTIHDAIEKLKDNECLHFTTRAQHVQALARSTTRHNKTEQNITKQNTSIGVDAPRLTPTGLNHSVSRFIKTYIKSYEERYKARPHVDKKMAGQIQNFLKSTSEQRACEMIQVYLQMNDKWFVTKAHDFSTFLANTTKVAVALQTGEDVGAPKKERSFAEVWAEEEEKNGH